MRIATAELMLQLGLVAGLVLGTGIVTSCGVQAPAGSIGTYPTGTTPTGSSPTPGTSPASSTSPTPTAVSFSTQVAPLLKTRCAACHGVNGSGGVSLFDGAGNASYSAIKSSIGSIIRAVSSGSMPQGGSRFTQTQVQVLPTWQSEGTPNN